MNQYEIWLAKLKEPAGRRPVLLLSRASAYEVLRNVMVVEVTTRVRSIPEEVVLGRREGLPRGCVANLDKVHVVSKARLEHRIGTLAGRRIVEVKRALGHALGWPELTIGD